MTSGMSSRIEAAAVYSLVFLAALIWIEVRIGLLAQSTGFLIPYAALVIISSTIAYYFGDLYRLNANSKLYYLWVTLTPIGILISASTLTSAIYFFAAYLFSEQRAGFWNHMEVIYVLPIVFFYQTWPVLLAGLPMATLGMVLRRRAGERYSDVEGFKRNESRP